MKVDVENGLVSQGTVVLKQVIRRSSGDLHHCPRNPRQNPPHRCGRIVAQLVKRCCFLLGNHQRVPRTDGEDVEKRQDVCILVDLEARNLAPDDL